MRRLYWAIKPHKGRTGLMGVYWFSRLYTYPAFAGCTTALFKTRALARSHLPQVKNKHGYPYARVVRVEIVEAK